MHEKRFWVITESHDAASLSKLQDINYTVNKNNNLTLNWKAISINCISGLIQSTKWCTTNFAIEIYGEMMFDYMQSRTAKQDTFDSCTITMLFLSENSTVINNFILREVSRVYLLCDLKLFGWTRAYEIIFSLKKF